MARASAGTCTPDVEEAVEGVPLEEQAAIAPPGPEPSVICLIIKPKVHISHG